MKTIIIATMGSKGDVEPYIALEIELKKKGYDENSGSRNKKIRDLVEIITDAFL